MLMSVLPVGKTCFTTTTTTSTTQYTLKGLLNCWCQTLLSSNLSVRHWHVQRKYYNVDRNKNLPIQNDQRNKHVCSTLQNQFVSQKIFLFNICHQTKLFSQLCNECLDIVTCSQSITRVLNPGGPRVSHCNRAQGEPEAADASRDKAVFDGQNRSQTRTREHEAWIRHDG